MLMISCSGCALAVAVDARRDRSAGSNAFGSVLFSFPNRHRHGSYISGCCVSGSEGKGEGRSFEILPR